MTDQSRIEELRRRVQRDPASIAFAQLAEEQRRAGQLAEAVETCRAGLAQHSGFVSARVTLGRALLGLGRLDEAHSELRAALDAAPDHLAAMRALAETCRKLGRAEEAMSLYRIALTLAPNDPDLDRIFAELSPGSNGGSRPAAVDLRSIAAELRSAPADSRSVAEELRPSPPEPRSTPNPQSGRAPATLAALESWLAAIRAARADRRA